MDLQTMLKKVKSKLYKSKREFKDDLDLMWTNCFLYNATEVPDHFSPASGLLSITLRIIHSANAQIDSRRKQKGFS